MALAVTGLVWSALSTDGSARCHRQTLLTCNPECTWWRPCRGVQVAWARMLISWQLELADKKLRPAGSPAHDTTLSHICPFPKHASSCPAADTDAFLARHAPRQVLPATPCFAAFAPRSARLSRHTRHHP